MTWLPKPKKVPKVKPSQAVVAVRRELQECCRTHHVTKAMELYHQAKLDGVAIEATSYYNLLNLCERLCSHGIHIGTPRASASHQQQTQLTTTATTPADGDDDDHDTTTTTTTPVDDETRYEYALTLQADMKDQNIAWTETAFTAMVRLLSKAGRLEDAHALVNQAEQTQQCKARLRLYSSLLVAYCDCGKLVDALALWNQLHAKKLFLSERDYAAILTCATGHQDARVVDRVLSDLAEDILVPSKETMECIIQWFQQVNPTTTETTESALDQVSLFPTHSPSMGPVTGARHLWKIDRNCAIADGILQTGCLAQCSLKPVPLSDTDWNDMMVANASIVLDGTLDDHTSTYQGGGKGRKRKRNDKHGREQWQDFQAFLNNTYPPHSHGLHVVIDGANVGYYKQNFEAAPKHVDYHQIDWIVRHFQQENKNVLLVLHERHFSKKLMPQWAEPIVKSWANILFRAPAGMNDDWFWLHAALWGGRSTLVVTNDEMRDHHFQMLAPRSFLRWKERQQIHFSFGTWNQKGRELSLDYPAKYSRRIQRVADGLVVPLPKRGDENRFLDGVHVASDEEPEEETYLCIRPKLME